MRELKEQVKLVNIAFETSKAPKNHQGFKIYKSLVYHRFFEVLSNAYPLWYEEVEKKRFKKAIYKFMQHGAKSDVVWKMPNEFRKFIKKSKLFNDIPYLNDLLWFEWIEVELVMKNYKKEKLKKFSYSFEYKLSNSSVLKKLKHKVYKKECFNEKGEYYLLAYYDFRDYEVYFREISEVLYLFLKELKKSGLKKAIKKVAKLSQSKQKEVESFLKDALSELVQIRVIKPKLCNRNH